MERLSWQQRGSQTITAPALALKSRLGPRCSVFGTKKRPAGHTTGTVQPEQQHQISNPPLWRSRLHHRRPETPGFSATGSASWSAPCATAVRGPPCRGQRRRGPKESHEQWLVPNWNAMISNPNGVPQRLQPRMCKEPQGLCMKERLTGKGKADTTAIQPATASEGRHPE